MAKWVRTETRSLKGVTFGKWWRKGYEFEGEESGGVVVEQGEEGSRQRIHLLENVKKLYDEVR